MQHRVGPDRFDDVPQGARAQVSLHHLGTLKRAARLAEINSRNELDRWLLLEPAHQLRGETSCDTGNENPSALLLGCHRSRSLLARSVRRPAEKRGSRPRAISRRARPNGITTTKPPMVSRPVEPRAHQSVEKAAPIEPAEVIERNPNR